MYKLLSIVFTFLILSVFFVSPVSAQEWIIDRYHSDVEVLTSGEVKVIETIQVDFQNLQKHGIYRDIPYQYESDGGIEYTEIEVITVTQDEHSATYETSKNNGYIRIKIGDANKTISGEHTYAISYIMRGILRGFETHDELYLNVVGPYWEVPITEASAKVKLPKDGITDAQCFVGSYGSETDCSFQTTADEAVFTAGRVLNSYEGFTIVLGYEKGMVPLLTVERPKSFLEKVRELPSLVLLLGSVFIGVGGVFAFWYRNGRDFWKRNDMTSETGNTGEVRPLGAHETVVVEYEPPDNLRPAEIGVLVDEMAHTHDVTATIVDLAVRGYLSITEIPKKWMFGKSDYLLTRKKIDTSQLTQYEVLLLSHLFGSQTEVHISELKNTFYKKLAEVKTELYKEVVSKQFFSDNPEKIRDKYGVIGVVTLMVFVGLLILGMTNEIVALFDIGIGGMVTGVLLLLYSRFMPRRTARGRELFRRVRGYRLFIETVETHRQKFFEKKNLFNEVLPYAIVFELTDKYIQAMKELGIKPSTSSWYHGSRPFAMSHFASSMNNLSSSMSQSMAKAPQSSGFSGGSSGGGFGGGGGGSW